MTKGKKKASPAVADMFKLTVPGGFVITTAQFGTALTRVWLELHRYRHIYMRRVWDGSMVSLVKGDDDLITFTRYTPVGDEVPADEAPWRYPWMEAIRERVASWNRSRTEGVS